MKYYRYQEGVRWPRHARIDPGAPGRAEYLDDDTGQWVVKPDAVPREVRRGTGWKRCAESKALRFAAARELEHDAGSVMRDGLRDRPSLAASTTADADLTAGEWESALIEFIEYAPDLVPVEIVDRFDAFLEHVEYDALRVVGRRKIAVYRER